MTDMLNITFGNLGMITRL